MPVIDLTISSPPAAAKRALASPPRHPAAAKKARVEPDDEPQDRPPAEFMSLARAVLPSVSQRTIMQSWDRSRGIGGGGDPSAAYDPESPRVQAAINLIFELHPSTPPRQGKKRERSVELLEFEQDARDWMDVDGRERLGQVYEDAALNALYSLFDRVSKSDIRKALASAGSFFAPAFTALQAAMEDDPAQRGFALLSSVRAEPKGKAREIVCVELEKERAWVMEGVRKVQQEKDEAERLVREAEAEIERGEYFECGCCFGETGFSLLVTCTEGFQFCRDCTLQLVNSQIGLRKFVLPCMAQDNCTAVFPESELRKFLPATTQLALHKLKQEKELDLAEIEGLAKCPYCPYAYIIDNPAERLFVCLREDCGKTTCLQCKKEDHLPKTCAEMDLDKKIDGIHKVEEAMTAALIRKCPKCEEPYIKEDGCNKITCPSCRTMSCYICSKIVKDYSHFKNAGTNATYTEPGATCLLWDDQKQRNFAEIEAARKAEAARVALENPAVVEADLQALNLAPPPPAPGPAFLPAYHARLPPPPPPVAMNAAQLVAHGQMLAEHAQRHAEAMALQHRMREAIEADRRAQMVLHEERKRVADQRAVIALAEVRRRRREADDAKAAKRDRLRRK